MILVSSKVENDQSTDLMPRGSVWLPSYASQQEPNLMTVSSWPCSEEGLSDPTPGTSPKAPDTSLGSLFDAQSLRPKPWP